MVVIGFMRMEFMLHGNDSLKGKRRVANSLKQKMRNKFNLSVAEVESQDCLNRLVLAAVSVGNSHVHVESRMNKALLMAEAVCPEELTDSSIEILSPE